MFLSIEEYARERTRIYIGEYLSRCHAEYAEKNFAESVTFTNLKRDFIDLV